MSESIAGVVLALDSDTLRRHASNVDRCATSAGTAVQAAGQVGFSSTMYGTLGQALVAPFMMPLQVAGQTATEMLQGSLQSTAGGVRNCADAFESLDHSVAQGMDKIREVVG